MKTVPGFRRSRTLLKVIVVGWVPENDEAGEMQVRPQIQTFDGPYTCSSFARESVAESLSSDFFCDEDQT